MMAAIDNTGDKKHTSAHIALLHSNSDISTPLQLAAVYYIFPSFSAKILSGFRTELTFISFLKCHFTFFRCKVVFRQDTHQNLMKYTDFFSVECSDSLYTYRSKSSKWNSCTPSYQSLQPVSARQTSFTTEIVCHFQHFRMHKRKPADPLLQFIKWNLKAEWCARPSLLVQ
jgi:hypothetical protein